MNNKLKRYFFVSRFIKKSKIHAPPTETIIWPIKPLKFKPKKPANQPPKNPPIIPTMIFPIMPKPLPFQSKPAKNPDIAPIIIKIKFQEPVVKTD